MKVNIRRSIEKKMEGEVRGRGKVGNQKSWLPKGLVIEKIQSLYPMVTEKNLIVVLYGDRKKI
jgi:hypothetical protein